MKKRGLLLHEKDTVVVALEPIESGDVITYACPNGTMAELISQEEIAPFHKLARTAIAKEAKIYKYGEVIGVATEAIELGHHVHEHNLI